MFDELRKELVSRSLWREFTAKHAASASETTLHESE